MPETMWVHKIDHRPVFASYRVGAVLYAGDYSAVIYLSWDGVKTTEVQIGAAFGASE